MEKALGGFHQRVVGQMLGMGPKCQRDDTWVYPPIGEELATVGLNEIKMYIKIRQNTVVQYIETCPIMDLFLAAERKTGCNYQDDDRNIPLRIF